MAPFLVDDVLDLVGKAGFFQPGHDGRAELTSRPGLVIGPRNEQDRGADLFDGDRRLLDRRRVGLGQPLVKTAVRSPQDDDAGERSALVRIVEESAETVPFSCSDTSMMDFLCGLATTHLNRRKPTSGSCSSADGLSKATSTASTESWE